MSDFDDLLGGDELPTKNLGGRPTREESERKLQAKLDLAKAATGKGLDDIGGVQALRRPVTIATLAAAFGHDVQTITRRLIDCPHIQQGNRRLYDFATACSYIVKPKMTPEQFIKTLNKADLPPEINLAFWNAQRAKIKFMLEAGEAWETGEVLMVLGEVFMTIKDSLTTIVEDMRERAKLDDAQAKMFEEAIDELRAILRQKLVEMPQQKRTPSLIDTPLFGTSKDIPVDSTDEWEPGEDDD
jgi:hypothetical protein